MAVDVFMVRRGAVFATLAAVMAGLAGQYQRVGASMMVGGNLKKVIHVCSLRQ